MVMRAHSFPYPSPVAHVLLPRHFGLKPTNICVSIGFGWSQTLLSHPFTTYKSNLFQIKLFKKGKKNQSHACRQFCRLKKLFYFILMKS